MPSRTGRWAAQARKHRNLIGAAVLVAISGIAVLSTSPWTVSAYALGGTGIWVQNTSYPGQYNRIDVAAHGTNSQTEASNSVIVQDGSSVLEATKSALTTFDSAAGETTTHYPLSGYQFSPSTDSSHQDIAMQDGVVAIASKNSVWVGTFDGTTVSLPGSAKPQITGLQGSVYLTVGADGTTVVLSGGSQTPTLSVLSKGAATPAVTTLAKGAFDSAPQLAVMDGHGVVLAGNNLYDGGNAPIDLSQYGASPTLQSWSATTASVAFATRSGLYQYTSGSVVHLIQSVRASGSNVIAPVVDGHGCTYGAWSEPGDADLARGCTGSENSFTNASNREIDEKASNATGYSADSCGTSTLRFIGDPVAPALNDTSTGCAFVASGDTYYAVPWKPHPTNDGRSQSPSPRDTTKTPGTPITPLAQLYAEVGTKAYLPVLVDDYDAAGDQLYVDSLTQPSAWSMPPLMPSPDGQTVIMDLTTAPNSMANTNITFTVNVSNGRGGTATGTVNVTIDKSAHPPQLLPGVAESNPTIYVPSGKSATYNVLKDWYSPAGLPLVIQGAVASAGSGVTVTWSNSGWITVWCNIFASGCGVNSSITVTVSDDQGTSADSPETLLVKDAGPVGGKPIVVDSVSVVTAGTTITVYPLAGSSDPTGGVLSLQKITALKGGPDPKQEPDNGVMFSTSGIPVGSYPYLFIAQNSQGTATGYLLLQVLSSNQVPITTPIGASLPSGGSATVDVLSHVTDPTQSGALALTQIRWATCGGNPVSSKTSACAGVTALIDRSNHVQLVDSQSGVGPVGTLLYTVVNSSGSAEGSVTVVRTVPSGPLLICPTVSAQVAPGGVVTVPLLQQDWSALGKQLTITLNSKAKSGLAWIDGGDLRYFASPGSASPGAIEYQLSDGTNTQTCYAVISVGAPSSDSPVPQNITASVEASGKVIIPVPLSVHTDGTPIDPSGSAVTLVGPGPDSPQLGTAEINPDGSGTSLVYQAKNNPGVDTFQYQVQNQAGTTATGSIAVLILADATQYSPPVAVNDSYTLPLGQPADLPVLDNDSDPQGQLLSVVEPFPTAANKDLQVSPSANHAYLHVVVPPSCAPANMVGGVCTWNVTYYAAAGQGRQSVDPATVTIRASSAAGAGLPITAHDLYLTSFTPSGSTAIGSLANSVTDPNHGGLTYSVVSGSANVDPKTGKVSVALQANAQAVVYKATDGQQTAEAVIWVPGLAASIPHLDTSAPPVVIDATQSANASVKLSDYIKSAPGSKVTFLSCTFLQQSIPCSGPDPTVSLEVSSNSPSGEYSLAVSALATSNTSGKSSNPITLNIPVTVKGALMLGQITPSPVSLYYQTTAPTIDLRSYLTCNDTVCPSDTQLKWSPPSGYDQSLLAVDVTSAGSLTVQAVASQQSTSQQTTISVTVTTQNTNSEANSIVVLKIPVMVLSNPVEVTSTRCDLTVKVPSHSAGSTSCDLSQHVLVTNGAAAAGGASIGTVTYTPLGGWSDQGWSEPTVSGSTMTIAPKYSSTPVTITYSIACDICGTASVTTGTVVVTTEAPPSMVTGLQAGPPEVQNAKNQINLTWSAPNDNGAPITGYDATAVGTSGDTVHCGPVTQTSCDLVGLLNASTYSVTVTATNEAGTSDLSATFTTQQTDNKPDPTIVSSVTSGDGSITVNWTPPKDNGTPITGYVAYALDASDAVQGECTADGSATSCTITGLTNGTQYSVRVDATNALGTTNGTTAEGPYVPNRPPDAPDKPSATATTDGTGTVTVSWNKPQSDGGLPIDHYTVTSANGPTAGTTVCTVQAPQTSCDIHGLTLGLSYAYTVSATAEGSGISTTSVQSLMSDSATPIGAPTWTNIPTVTQSASSDPGTIHVDWSGININGSTISKYTATVKDSSGISAGQCSTTTASYTYCDISKLNPGTQYTVTVHVDATGYSNRPTSDAVSDAFTPGVPSAPTDVSAMIQTDGSITVSWTAPTLFSSAVTSYAVTVLGQDQKPLNPQPNCSFTNSAANSCTITSTSLPDGTYYFTVVSNVQGAPTSSESSPLMIPPSSTTTSSTP